MDGLESVREIRGRSLFPEGFVTYFQISKLQPYPGTSTLPLTTYVTSSSAVWLPDIGRASHSFYRRGEELVLIDDPVLSRTEGNKCDSWDLEAEYFLGIDDNGSRCLALLGHTNAPFQPRYCCESLFFANRNINRLQRNWLPFGTSGVKSTREE